MDHEGAFLQAIREHPHDDAPRLIYADWLEEQGGAALTARGNFIRIQCRLAELPDDDPARDPLEDEATDLLAEHEDEWTQPLHGIAEDWRFSRGFIEYIRINGPNFLTHAERLFNFTPVRALHLLIHVKDVPHLAACPQLQRIEALDFHRSYLNDRSLQLLLTSPHLERLTALNLTGNGINTPGVKALVHAPIFTRLRLLDVSGNSGVGDRAVSLLAHARSDSLQTLNLAHTNTTFTGVRELFQSSQLAGLTDLNVRGTRFFPGMGASGLRELIDTPLLGQLRSLDLSATDTLSGLRFLLASPQVARLRKLYLCGIRADAAAIEPLANSSYLASLTTLDVGQNNLGADGAQALADSPHLTALTHLDVGSNNIRDRGAFAIAESPHLRRLLVLDLAGNGIGGPGMKALAGSANLDDVRTLHLDSNFIGADSVRVLAESAHLRNLTQLDLSDAFLEEESAHALASSANLARLTTLRLAKNLLGDGGAKALAQSPHLRRLVHLDLNDNRIGKAGAEALAAAAWLRMRSLDVRGNVFTDTQEALLRQRFGDAVQL